MRKKFMVCRVHYIVLIFNILLLSSYCNLIAYKPNTDGTFPTSSPASFQKLYGCDSSMQPNTLYDVGGYEYASSYTLDDPSDFKCRKVSVSSDETYFFLDESNRWMFFNGSEVLVGGNSTYNFIDIHASSGGRGIGVDDRHVAQLFENDPFSLTRLGCCVVRCAVDEDFITYMCVGDNRYLYRWDVDTDWWVHLDDILEIEDLKFTQPSDQKFLIVNKQSTNEIYATRWPEGGNDFQMIPTSNFPSNIRLDDVSKDGRMSIANTSSDEVYYADLFTWSCYGIISHSKDVCSGNGLCVAEDTCQCIPYGDFTDDDCRYSKFGAHRPFGLGHAVDVALVDSTLGYVCGVNNKMWRSSHTFNFMYSRTWEGNTPDDSDCEQVAAGSDGTLFMMNSNNISLREDNSWTDISTNIISLDAASNQRACAITDIFLMYLYEKDPPRWHVLGCCCLKCMVNDDFTIHMCIGGGFNQIWEFDYNIDMFVQLTDMDGRMSDASMTKPSNQQFIIGVKLGTNETYAIRYPQDIDQFPATLHRLPSEFPSEIISFDVAKDGTFIARDNSSLVYGGKMLYWNCFGIKAHRKEACSGNGVCVELDLCSCVEGFSGSECEYKYTDTPYFRNDLFVELIGGTGCSMMSEYSSTRGGYLATGSSSGFTSGLDLLLLQLDYKGEIAWFKTYGLGSSDPSYHIFTKSILLLTSDDCVAIEGYVNNVTTTVSFLAKLDSQYGDLLWKIEESAPCYYGGVVEYSQNNDNLLWVSGNGMSIFLRTVDTATGNVISSKKINATINSFFRLLDVESTSDGGFVLVGDVSSGGVDINVIRLDSDLNILWSSRIGNGTGLWESGEGIREILSSPSNGGFIITGHTGHPYAGINDLVALRLNSTGGFVWFKKYDFPDLDSVIGYDLEEDLTGSFLIVGKGKGVIMKISADNGDVLWSQRVSSSTSENDNLWGIRKTVFDNRNNFLVSGTIEGKCFLSKLDVDGRCVTQSSSLCNNDVFEPVSVIVSDLPSSFWEDNTDIISITEITPTATTGPSWSHTTSLGTLTLNKVCNTSVSDDLHFFSETIRLGDLSKEYCTNFIESSSSSFQNEMLFAVGGTSSRFWTGGLTIGLNSRRFGMMMRMTEKGEILWMKSFGNPLDNIYPTSSILLDDDIIVWGQSTMYTWDSNTYTSFVNRISGSNNGEILWGVNVFEISSLDHHGSVIEFDELYLLWITHHDHEQQQVPILRKMYNNNGSVNSMWLIAFTNNYYERVEEEYQNITITIRDMKRTSDGGMILVGETSVKNRNNTSSILVLRLDHDFSLSWAVRVGNYSSDDDWNYFTASSVRETSDGSYIILTGSSRNNNTIVLKLSSSSGEIVWFIEYDIDGCDRCFGKDVEEMKTGDAYIIAVEGMVVLIKVSSDNGELIWAKRHKNSVYHYEDDEESQYWGEKRDGVFKISPYNSYKNPNLVNLVRNGSFLVSGKLNNECYLAKIDGENMFLKNINNTNQSVLFEDIPIEVTDYSSSVPWTDISKYVNVKNIPISSEGISTYGNPNHDVLSNDNIIGIVPEVETYECPDLLSCFTCFSIRNDDTERVCNGNGDCISTDECDCGELFYGDKCQYLKRFENCSWSSDGLVALFSFDLTYDDITSTLHVPTIVVNDIYNESPSFSITSDEANVPFGTHIIVKDEGYLQVLGTTQAGLSSGSGFLTLSFWIKSVPDHSRFGGEIGMDGESWGRDWFIDIFDFGKFIIHRRIGDVLYYLQLSDDDITLSPVDEWSHVVCQFSEIGEDIEVYINNETAPLTVVTTHDLGEPNQPYDIPLHISGPNSYYQRFDGMLGCFHIYRRNLSRQEISYLYSDGCSCFSEYKSHCFGVSSDDPNVCSGRGQCDESGVCTCDDNDLYYFGENCENYVYENCSWPVDDDLVAIYSFENTYDDLSLNQYSSEIYGPIDFTRVYDVDQFGMAVSYLNQNKSIVIKDSELVFMPDHNFTVSVWLNAYNSSYGRLWSTYFSTNKGFYISLFNANSVRAHECRNRTMYYREQVGTIDEIGWHHIVVSTDRDNPLVIFIDGSEVVMGEVTAFDNCDWVYDNPPGDMQMGEKQVSPFFFEGDFACVHLYNRSLNLDEVQSLYDDGCSCFSNYTHCFGVSKNNISNVCSGHGECVSENKCVCLNDRYTGDNCSINLFPDIPDTCSWPVDGLVAIYSFDETFDDVFTDKRVSNIIQSGGGRGNPVVFKIEDSTKVPFGLSIEFEGQTSMNETNYFTVGDSEDILLGDESYTVSVWTKLAYVDHPDRDYQYIISKNVGDSLNNGWYVHWIESISAIRAHECRGGKFRYVDTFVPVNYTEWHHIVVTSSDDDQNNLLQVYIDGKIHITQREFENPSMDDRCLGDSHQPIRIAGNGVYFGKIGCIHLYNRSISTEEVDALFEHGCSCFSDYDFTCFGISHLNESFVCSGRGQCVEPDKCVCDDYPNFIRTRDCYTGELRIIEEYPDVVVQFNQSSYVDILISNFEVQTDNMNPNSIAQDKYEKQDENDEFILIEINEEELLEKFPIFSSEFDVVVDDIVERKDPILLHSLSLGGSSEGNDILVMSDYLFVAGGDVASRLKVYNISDLSNTPPVLLDESDELGIRHFVFSSDSNYLYCTGNDAFRVLDISDPTSITQVGGKVTGSSFGIYLDKDDDNKLYVCEYDNGLRIYDVSFPTSPVVMETIDPVGNNNLRDVVVKDGIGFVANSDDIFGFDATDLQNIVKYRQSYSTNLVRLEWKGDSYVYSCDFGAGLFRIFDVSNISNITQVYEYPVPSCHDLNIGGWNNSYIFAQGSGTWIFDISSDPSNPQILLNNSIDTPQAYSILSHNNNFFVGSSVTPLLIYEFGSLRIQIPSWTNLSLCSMGPVKVTARTNYGDMVSQSFDISLNTTGLGNLVDCQNQVFQCAEFLSNESNHVCNGLGNCTFSFSGPLSSDACECVNERLSSSEFCGSCVEGYTGENCNIPICFGIPGNVTEIVCSGNGDCVDSCDGGSCIFRCDCESEYFGAYCNITSCFGVWNNITDHSYCSSHGECSVFNRCTCDADYYGEMCNVTQCFGEYNNGTSFCSNHGSCHTHDKCFCQSGYFGFECNTTTCFGLWSNQTENPVCNNHGKCEIYDRCECSVDYFGVFCNETTCFGEMNNKSSNELCSGHGGCVEHNICICDSSYFGIFCNETTCFDIWNNDTSEYNVICSQHGYCTHYDRCDCEEDYYGVYCNETLCFGEWNNDTGYSFCSGVGNCRVHDHCDCQDQYYGLICNITECFGILQNFTDSVCKGHGDCVELDTCDCEPDYYGFFCNETTCFGDWNNDTVCSDHGICEEHDICQCEVDYFGIFCNETTCFNEWNNATGTDDVCTNGRGVCKVHDKCECLENYYGLECEITECFGKWTNDTDDVVCFGSDSGICVDYNNCSCLTEYYGLVCDIFDCYGLIHNDSDVCSGHGTCYSPDDCVACQTDWDGQKCEIYTGMCGIYKAIETEFVCSKHGVCEPEGCNCTEGYFGADCDFWTCDDPELGPVPRDYDTVCESHGDCVDKDTCVCFNGYYGNHCNTFYCGSYFNTDTSNVCSGHGSCVHPSICDCMQNYTGFDCQLELCFSILKSSKYVCSGHGVCDGGVCKCASGYKGLQCEEWYCSFDQTCNGHGECVSADMCKCNKSDEVGHWAEPSCQACQAGKSGVICTENLCTDPETFCFAHGVCDGGTGCNCCGNFDNSTYCGSCIHDFYGENCTVLCEKEL